MARSMRVEQEIFMKAAFSIDYILTPDAPGRNMTDFIWQCTRQTAEGETVKYSGETHFNGTSQWFSDAVQISPAPSLEDYAPTDAAGAPAVSNIGAFEHAVAKFVSERLQTHLTVPDASLADLIHTMSVEQFECCA